MTDLTRLTAAELAGLVATGDASAVEVTQAHLDRIAAVDGRVNAFLHVDADGALAAARAVDAKRASGAAPEATAAAEPPLDPPGTREWSHGLRTGP